MRLDTVWSAFGNPLLAVMLFLFGGSSVQAQDYHVSVETSFVAGAIRFTGELGVVYSFLWDAQEANRELVICGIGRYTRPRLRSTVRGMARGATLTINGQEIDFDLTFFTSARTLASMREELATCRSTGIPISRVNGPIELRFAPGTWRN